MVDFLAISATAPVLASAFAVEPVESTPTPAPAPPKPAVTPDGDDLHNRWVANGAPQGSGSAHGDGHAHGVHFDFDAVRAHHTMPYPAIEWIHGHPKVIFNLAAYAGKNLEEIKNDPAFAKADFAPYHDWAVAKAAAYGSDSQTLAKAMAVADAKDWFTFPRALSFANNQTFFGTIALVLLAILLFKQRPKPGQIKPANTIQHMLEAVVLFIRDDIVRPNMKGPAAHGHDDHGHHHGDGHGHAKTAVSSFGYADRWVPHFAALFLGILAFNLVGLIPGGGTASGNPGVTFAFAVTTLLSMLIFGFKEQGFVRFWINLVPVHWSWKPMDMLVWCLLFVIELLGLLIKPAALAIRLAANMFAGHTALLAFTALGFIIFTGDPSQGTLSLGLGVVGWVVGVALYFLELLVAFIQAYIFTLLSAIFIGSSIHPEH